MSNSYGFDFLKSEHLDPTAHGTNDAAGGNDDEDNDPDEMDDVEINGNVASAKNKPDLEKQFEILTFLKDHRGSGCLAPNVIYKATGIDLDVDVAVAEMLQRNPKVRVEMVPDPENPALSVPTFAYQAKYSNIRDRTTLLAQINQMTSGVSMRDLLDSYSQVEEDLRALITAGDIVAITNNEDKDKILFPRGEAFLVELDGLISMPTQRSTNANASMNGKSKHSDGHADMVNGIKKSAEHHKKGSLNGATIPEIYVVETDVDPCNQIRRGEAIQVGGQWFRVSSAVREGPLSDQPARAQPPLSVVSLADLSKRNEVDGYIRPLSAKTVPLDSSLSKTAYQNVQAAKSARERLIKLTSHGRSGTGAIGQILGSNAHASNPTTLATSFAAGMSTSGGGAHHGGAYAMHRKRGAATTSNIAGFSNKTPGSSGDPSSTTAPLDHKNMRETLEEVAGDPALASYSHARRHGCTKDVREMYLATRSLVPESDTDLHQLLLEHKLIEPGEQMRRRRLAKSANVDNDGKPKKRRYYTNKNQRMTNTHLEGTEIGAVLARAAERQKQGKTVGDGGM